MDTPPQFAWDRAKSDRCFAERGFDFQYASRLFKGPVLERQDSRRDYGETRIQAIGSIGGRLFFVVYTQRGETKRILSARRAHRKELEQWRL